MYPINFCKMSNLFLIDSNAIAEVTKKVKIMYHVASTILAVKIKKTFKIMSLSDDINCE